MKQGTDKASFPNLALWSRIQKISTVTSKTALSGHYELANCPKGQWFHRIFTYAEMPLVTCVITVGINNDEMNVYLEIFYNSVFIAEDTLVNLLLVQHQVKIFICTYLNKQSVNYFVQYKHIAILFMSTTNYLQLKNLFSCLFCFVFF